jgi:acyl-CoA ligase (AMP-forming) (exosortase A-associated)
VRTRIHDLLAEAASETPEAPALTYRRDTLDYAHLWARVRGFGTALAGLGLSRGARVAVFADKRHETVIALFGTSAAGGVFVPVNPVLKARQVGYILRDSGARVLVTTAERLALLADELAASPTVRDIVLIGDPASAADSSSAADSPSAVDSPSGAGPVVHRWPEAASGDVPAPGPSPARGTRPGGGVDGDPAAILYTSGSTGGPKGVVLSHRNLIVGAESVSSYLGNTADDVILSALPLSFDAGFSQLTTAFSVGAHVVLVNYLLPRDVLKACAKHGVTGLTCVPPLWIQLAALDWPEPVGSRLRYFANTGGRMPRATLTRLRGHFPKAQPFLMYGLTEAFRSTYLDPDEVDTRPDSIGRAIPNAEILVVRPDGTPCGPGEEGELVHRGPLVSLGYWNDPERTAERFRPAPGAEPGLCLPEPAVWSGDAVVADEEGFLYFVGRKDDMIKTSGYRVSPTEIEEAAYDTGLVSDAVALGLADDELGHRVVLIASPAGGSELDTEELLTRLRAALPLYMVPKEIVVRSQLPRSPNGKFDRTLLRGELDR